MKILVFSDSHGDYPQLFRALDCAGPVQQVVHLGDGAQDAEILAQALEMEVLRVAGNCDFCSTLPQEVLYGVAHHKVLATHGSSYLVKSGLAFLAGRAREIGATLVLYGHSHRAEVVERDGVLLVNPGSIAGGSGTYAVVDLGGEAPRIELYRLQGDGAAPLPL